MKMMSVILMIRLLHLKKQKWKTISFYYLKLSYIVALRYHSCLRLWFCCWCLVAQEITIFLVRFILSRTRVHFSLEVRILKCFLDLCRTIHKTHGHCRLMVNSIHCLYLWLTNLRAAISAGTSTPSFGQNVAAGHIPFGSPGTPGQGFNAVPFGRSWMRFLIYVVILEPSWAILQPSLLRPLYTLWLLIYGRYMKRLLYFSLYCLSLGINKN